MSNNLPEISKRISSEDLVNVFNERYSEIIPIWVPMQMDWLNGLYRTFCDYEKFMITIHLMVKTFDFYSKNFVRISYDKFFNQNQIEIELINIMEISKSLNIPKETTRRKINELEDLGTIKRLKKKIIIDRNIWPNIKPEDTIKRISRFLSFLTKILYEKKIISISLTTEEINKVVKENFSHVWKLYYEMQLPMLLSFKKVHGDLESFHIWGVCVVNEILNSKKNNNSEMSKEIYLKKYLFNNNKKSAGINAMSISDITGIPRATVIRKLNKLVVKKFLITDEKKQYLSTGQHSQKIVELQKNNFINLSKFAERIYNLCLSQYKK